MSQAEISLAYKQTIAGDSFPKYEPNNPENTDSNDDQLASYTALKNKPGDFAEDYAEDYAENGANAEYDIENLSPEMLLSLAPYIGI